MSIQIRASDGGTTSVETQAVERLAGGLRGRIAFPESPEYEQARTVWNAMIDRRPAMVVRCAGAADVATTVRFARDHELLLSIRGGGHNIAGSAVADGGVMIDLSPMKSVRVDPHTRTARVEPGVTLGEFDREAQAHALATPIGINSTTGIAGLTVGGGFGWLSRRYGLTVDNLLSADVVTADGQLLRASEHENEDLFWAIRGGGGNFGIVTSFEFRMHAVGPEILSGLVIHPLGAAPSVLRFYREYMEQTPDEFTCWFVMRKAPPLPFLPEEWHGREILALAIAWFGDMAEGERIARPLREVGTPIADVVAPHQYSAWQTVLDPLLTPGARNYWKSHDFTQVSDGLVDVLMDFAGRIPDPNTEIAMAQLGGAVSRVAGDATAYSHRDGRHVMNVHTRWTDPAKDAECIEWARALWRAASPFATGAVYVNFLTEEEGDRVKAAYGPNLDRLAALKAKYDPTNLFRANINIRPTVAAAMPRSGLEAPAPRAEA